MMPLGCPPQISYFKRFKMEVDLVRMPAAPALPEGFSWVPWDTYLLDAHAETLHGCFCEEIDSTVFASLGSRNGCQYLMTEISRKPGFLAEATWLLTCPDGYCGTVQGVRERSGMGAIQNLGVLPSYRGRGLGSAMLMQSLRGFYQVGLGRAYLEVTAQNDAAVRLYSRLGFRRRKTVYKTVETASVFA